MAFHGTYDHNLDAKNRVTVPSKFRASLSDGVVIAQGFSACLTVWPASEYAAFAGEALAGRNPIADDTIKLQRFFFANAHETELDAAGRIMVPPPLMDHGGFDKEIVVSGLGRFFELWDRAAWATENASLPEHVARMTADPDHAG